MGCVESVDYIEVACNPIFTLPVPPLHLPCMHQLPTASLPVHPNRGLFIHTLLDTFPHLPVPTRYETEMSQPDALQPYPACPLLWSSSQRGGSCDGRSRSVQ